MTRQKWCIVQPNEIKYEDGTIETIERPVIEVSDILPTTVRNEKLGVCVNICGHDIGVGLIGRDQLEKGETRTAPNDVLSGDVVFDADTLAKICEAANEKFWPAFIAYVDDDNALTREKITLYCAWGKDDTMPLLSRCYFADEY